MQFWVSDGAILCFFFHFVKCISGSCPTPVVRSCDVICMRLVLRLMMVTILVLPLPVGFAV